MRPAPLRPAAAVSTAAAQPQRYLTNDEAAEYLRLSPRTLEKQRVIGGGPRFRKFGRRVMYAVADWYSDGGLRSKVRRLVRRGDELMRGGYRRLAQLPPPEKGRFDADAKRP